MPSVVIPAHNEQTVIGRCILALLNGAGADELEIIVVCNGCADQTAIEAGRFAPAVRVIETPVASKTHALNLGDASATRFPRFFVDADVVLPFEAVRRITERLESGLLAAAPRGRIELDGCSWAVKAFYRINDRLPSSHDGIGGSGVYALSEEGRKRVGHFPDIIADDGYVRIHFTPRERETVEGCRSTVFAPKTLRGLIRIKTRSYMGSAELKHLVPAMWSTKGPSNSRKLLSLFAEPPLWPQLFVYLYVKLVARTIGRWRMRSGDRTWQRDDSSRLAKSRFEESPSLTSASDLAHV